MSDEAVGIDGTSVIDESYARRLGRKLLDRTASHVPQDEDGEWQGIESIPTRPGYSLVPARTVISVDINAMGHATAKFVANNDTANIIKTWKAAIIRAE